MTTLKNNPYPRIVPKKKNKSRPIFTKHFNIKKLVYYEQFPTIMHAIRREKVLKEWNRQWKERLIKKLNPEWKDLYKDICF